VVLALGADAALAAPGSFATDLTELSIEELMDLQVTSEGRRPQRLSDVAAAIFVITQDDIRRSGATSIPELLRMVPGCSVARINASQWAVTCRGFNGRFANKLLVLVDGRTVYTPLFSSVFWEEQSIPLENIERIEVIRGPPPCEAPTRSTVSSMSSPSRCGTPRALW
jgi:iron complex outermembrane receptor protein